MVQCQPEREAFELDGRFSGAPEVHRPVESPGSLVFGTRVQRERSNPVLSRTSFERLDHPGPDAVALPFGRHAQSSQLCRRGVVVDCLAHSATGERSVGVLDEDRP